MEPQHLSPNASILSKPVMTLYPINPTTPHKIPTIKADNISIGLDTGSRQCKAQLMQNGVIIYVCQYSINGRRGNTRANNQLDESLGKIAVLAPDQKSQFYHHEGGLKLERGKSAPKASARPSKGAQSHDPSDRSGKQCFLFP